MIDESTNFKERQTDRQTNRQTERREWGEIWDCFLFFFVLFDFAKRKRQLKSDIFTVLTCFQYRLSMFPPKNMYLFKPRKEG